MEMRKQSQIQETECMEFVGGEMRITFLGHEQLQGGNESINGKGKLKGTSLGGDGEIKGCPSSMFNTYSGHF